MAERSPARPTRGRLVVDKRDFWRSYKPQLRRPVLLISTTVFITWAYVARNERIGEREFVIVDVILLTGYLLVYSLVRRLRRSRDRRLSFLH